MLEPSESIASSAKGRILLHLGLAGLLLGVMAFVGRKAQRAIAEADPENG